MPVDRRATCGACTWPRATGVSARHRAPAGATPARRPRARGPPRPACPTPRSPGSGRATWPTRARRRSRRRSRTNGPRSQAKARGGRFSPPRPAQAFVQAVRPPALRCAAVDLLEQPLAGSRAAGRGHRDQRPRRRRLRAHRGRRGAGGRRRAPRQLGVAGAGGVPAVARDRALHRDHPADGGRGARRRPRCCRELAEMLDGPACWWPTTPRFDAASCARPSSAPGLDWPAPPVLCTVALARRFAPLVRQRGLALLAESLGIEVGVTHRALPDALTCARILCALFGRLCAHAATVGRRRGAAAPALAARAPRAGERPRAAPAPARGPPRPLPAPPRPRRLRVPRRARAPALRGQVGVAAHPRPLALLRPGGMDRAGGDRGLQADELGAGGARAGEPPDQGVAPARQPRAQAHRPLGLRALPSRHPLPGAGGLAGARRGPRRERRAAARPDGRARAGRPPHVAVQAAPLRPRDAPPRPPVDLRPDGPLLLTLPRRPRPQRLPPARWTRRWACSTAPTPPARCSADLDERDRRRLGRAALRAGGGAAAAVRAPASRCWTGWAACCARCTPSHGSCSPATPSQERYDALWIVGGRVVDWGAAARPSRARWHGAPRRRSSARRRGRWDPRRSTRSGSSRPGWPRTSRRRWRSRPRPRRRGSARFVRPTRSAGELGADVRPPLARPPEAGPRVRAVAERLGGRPPAAAERDHLALLAQVVLVAVGVHERDRPRDLVGPVLADLDLDLRHRAGARPGQPAESSPSGAGGASGTSGRTSGASGRSCRRRPARRSRPRGRPRRRRPRRPPPPSRACARAWGS